MTMVRVAAIMNTLPGVWAYALSSIGVHFDPSKFRVRC